MKEIEEKIKSPNHYKLDGLNIESIDVIKAVLTDEEFRGFLKGNILKYNIRANKKNGIEDYKKSAQYNEWLVELMECENNGSDRKL